jgi:putative acetyltransferase
MDEFRERLSHGLTMVAEEEGRPIAFGQFEPVDHLALLYTAGGYARRGIASRLYDVLEEQARAQGVAGIHTEASRISRPFFLKRGYVVSEVERSLYRGVEFERFKMRKELVSIGSARAVKGDIPTY